MARNKYPHFNPTKHNLKVKVAVVRTSAHSKHNINYHFIWIPKYRRKMLVRGVAKVLRDIIIGQCEEMGVEMLALEIMPDHLHLFVGAKPTHRPCDIVKKIKGNTAIQLRRCFKHLPYLGYLGYRYRKRFKNLWARGYYCGSAGHVSQNTVKKYIEEQHGKDVFEYSIFENPKVKIGDFTQTKMKEWKS